MTRSNKIDHFINRAHELAEREIVKHEIEHSLKARIIRKVEGMVNSERKPYKIDSGGTEHYHGNYWNRGYSEALKDMLQAIKNIEEEEMKDTVNGGICNKCGEKNIDIVGPNIHKCLTKPTQKSSFISKLEEILEYFRFTRGIGTFEITRDQIIDLIDKEIIGEDLRHATNTKEVQEVVKLNEGNITEDEILSEMQKDIDAQNQLRLSQREILRRGK